jgi:hypothetical protein
MARVILRWRQRIVESGSEPLCSPVVEMLRTEAAINLWGVSSSIGSINFSDSTSSVIGQRGVGQTCLLSFWFSNFALAKDAWCGSSMASTIVPSGVAISRRLFRHYLFAPILAVLLVSFPGVALTQKATTMANASPIEKTVRRIHQADLRQRFEADDREKLRCDNLTLHRR